VNSPSRNSKNEAFLPA